MQVQRLAHFSLSLAVLLGALRLGAAQASYDLRGKGAAPGTTWTQNLVIKVQEKANRQGQSTDSTTFSQAEGRIQVKTADAGGDIVEALETYTGKISTPGGPQRVFPSAKLFNREVQCTLTDGIWLAALDELSDGIEVQNEHSDLPMPGLQRNFLPVTKVPVGHTWKFGSKEFASLLANQLPDHARRIKVLAGSATCTFEKLGQVEGVPCTYLKISYSFSGSMAQDDTRLLPMKIRLQGNASEIRRLDTGILVQQNSLLEISGSGQGNSLALSIDRFATQNFAGNP